MINIKPIIYNALKTITDVEISTEYPSEWVTFPKITYAEENNETYKKINNKEVMAKVRYKIDIYNIESTSSLASKVDDVITSLGLTRIFCGDADIKDCKHKILRYQGIIDIRTMNVHN